ncbi:MAG TPA: ATP-binding protein, partial [Mucilaginibacter sp.]|nr:ATP-binding protein [Mucilaginibacter sp.]
TAFEKLKTLSGDEQEALRTIQKFTTEQNIWLITTRNGHLEFWSGIKIIPDRLRHIHEGYSFIHEDNGYYDVVKKTEGNFSALFFIPVKADYPFENKYLQNTFAKNLLNDNNIQIADFADKNIYEINSINNTYLFSVKADPDQVSHKFFYFEAVVWTLCILVLCLLIHSICNHFSRKGYPYLSFLLLGAFIIGERFINLYYHFPDFRYKPRLFDPVLYTSGALFHSFGDFCINVLAITWFLVLVYRNRDKLLKPVHNKFAGYAVVFLSTSVLIISSELLLKLFYGLVMFSKVNFDVNNVLNLSAFSILGVLMLCFGFLIFYLLVEICLSVCKNLNIPVAHQVAILILGVGIITAISEHKNGEFTFFYLLWAVWVIIRGYAYQYNNARLSSGALVSIVLVCAVVSAIKLNHFLSLKEIGNRKAFVQTLKETDDTTADRIFKKIEKNIINDPEVTRYLTDTDRNIEYLKNYFQKTYFDGYLARYDVDAYGYDNRNEALSAIKKYELSVFKELVMYSANKVSDYFYRSIDAYGLDYYFALLPIYRNDSLLGTIVVELKSQTEQDENAFPELLAASNGRLSDDLKNYSYAFYSDNKLVGQYGKYIYSLTNNEFKGKLKQYVFKTTRAPEPSRYSLWTSYSHLIYQSSPRYLIVVSKEENVIIDTITSVTFFFIVFLVFSVLIFITRWLWARLRIMYIEDNYFHWVLRLNFDRILYKTRIQFSIVLAVMITLVLVGFITYISIVDQYDAQQENMISNKLSHIVKAFEIGGYDNIINHPTEDGQFKFDEFANTYSADLTLFDTNGNELVSTQPKIYDDKLIARKINARAYIYLNRLQKSGFINNEIVGLLHYKAAYAPVKDSKQRTLGYLQLPYFANEADYTSRVGSLLNAMINIYALIFIAIGLLAIIIARQITNPLNIIQYSLSKTIYGQKNEPIKWERNDEIGALVKEYNNMIAALERSAQKLAQSERESAWREMAKQVAHEIKNPLTPLKLGLQLLEKSWKDKDPKFDQKFERFSKSFVEQIESLSSIASEFSAFAKMPETRIERIDIFEVLTQVVTTFRQMENTRIVYHAPETSFYINADRDQLLRCFNNLLKNAIEATPQDREGVIEINYLITNKSILLSIKDNGSGIPENLRGKIFEPNFTTKSSGTGLGLAFVKNSVENAGGKVWFETAIGAGTTFYFSLPEAL